MKHVSSIHTGWLIGGLSLSSLFFTGCLRDVGLGSTGVGEVSGVGGTGGASGVGVVGVGGGGGAGVIGGVGGSGMGVGTSGVGGSSAVSSSGMGVGSSGVGGSSPAGCGLGGGVVSCDFAHLNADCASYGAVCDYIFNQCSCCFLHDDLTCTTDADCESSFGATAFCSGGTCGCK
jgi:hypothetical protein